MIRYLTFTFVLLSACAPRPHAGHTLSEAQALLAEALRMGETVQEQLHELDQRRIRIDIQGRALTPEEIKFTDEVRNLTARFEEWQQDQPSLSGQPKTVWQDQKNYLNTIKTIKEQTTALLNQ